LGAAGGRARPEEEYAILVSAEFKGVKGVKGVNGFLDCKTFIPLVSVEFKRVTEEIPFGKAPGWAAGAFRVSNRQN